MIELTEIEKKLVLAGFISGYIYGHEDTIERSYCDPTDRAKDYLDDAIKDGGLEYTISQITGAAIEKSGLSASALNVVLGK